MQQGLCRYEERKGPAASIATAMPWKTARHSRNLLPGWNHYTPEGYKSRCTKQLACVLWLPMTYHLGADRIPSAEYSHKILEAEGNQDAYDRVCDVKRNS